MRAGLVFAIFVWFSGTVIADGNRLAHLDHLDPYYVSTDFAKLVTPQWVGDPNVDCVVVLAIDDMRDVAKYEAYLRPILDRLKVIDGRAPVSIMTNSLDLNDASTAVQLKAWINEGLSIEVHTIDHPCPLLCDGDFAKAKSTYDRCVDLIGSIPNNQAVAFRMPCCDSLNTPSPRFWSEIFESSTPQGKHLSIDSSVFCITTEADSEVRRQQAVDDDGRPKFQKYLPFPSFVNTIQNYPYPYVIGRTCWEFPCIVPSDWEAQNLHRPNNPQTVDDMKTALDVVVQKKGTYNLVFHPHGWIRSDQVVEVIDHAVLKYGNRVKFMTFAECDECITKNLLGGHSLRSRVDANGSSISDVRILDIDGDGYQDVLRFDQENRKIFSRVWRPDQRDWIEASTSFHGRLPRFGILDKSNAASVVFVSNESNELTSIQWSDTGVWKRAVISTEISETSGAITDLRLRDLDGDGICEIIVARTDVSGVLKVTSDNRWHPLGFGLPQDVRMHVANHDALWLVDVDEDGDLDCLFSDAKNCSMHLFQSVEKGWSAPVFADDRRTGAATIPPFIRTDGSNNGAWIHSGSIWYQNEDTSRLPDHVDRRSLRELLNPASESSNASLFPPPRSSQETLASISTSPDVAVELVAAEPLVQDPVAFDWDVDGSLWVVEMRDYPNGLDGKGKPGGRIKHLIDTDGNGDFDQAETFLDEIPFPTGVKVWRDGILVTSAPTIFFAKDSDGDGRADIRETLFEGFGEGNQQHRVNGLTWGMDGWLYVSNGDSGGTIVSTKTKKQVSINGRDLRINPDTGEVEAIAGQTQFGRCVDAYGNWFGGNNSSPIWHYVRDDTYASRNPNYSGPSARRQIQQQPGAAPVYPTSKLLPRFNDFDRANRFTSACSPDIYRDELIGHPDSNFFFVCEPVHNLVHRESVRRDGLSFRTKRIAPETNSEVFASSDCWSRPVMSRTGPDGCVWVADMYRLVIEHPTWIPTDWQKQVNVRSGDDKGRIYRIVPSDLRKRESVADRKNDFRVALDQLSTQQLVERLSHPNGWHRDMAQQILLWRNDPQASTMLADMMKSTSSDVGKIYALHTQRLLGGLTADMVLQGIQEANDDVARHAIKNAEQLLNSDRRIGQAVCRRLETVPELSGIHQQAAYSLGEWRHERASQQLARLMHQFDDPYLTAAAMSSISSRNVAQVLRETHRLIGQSEGQLRNPEFVSELLRQAVLQGDAADIGVAAELFDRAADGFESAWQFDAFRAMQSAFNRRKDKSDWKQSPLAGVLPQLMKRAQATARNTDRTTRERVAAISLLTDHSSGDEMAWEELLLPIHSPAVNVAAVNAILGEDAGVTKLLGNWRQLSPRLRGQVLDRLLRSNETTLQLLFAIERKEIPAGELGILRQHQIRRHQDARVLRMADRLFGVREKTERSAIVARYQAAVPTDGDFNRGAKLFRELCSTCHRLGGVGKDVGPDLAALSDKTSPTLLSAILDPNRSVEERYVSYILQTSDGLLTAGVIADESATAVSIVAVDGKQKNILRNQIVSIRSGGQSLMPLGFEKELTPSGMADLIAFLQQQTAPRKIFPGNEPRVAPVRNDGSIRLFAVHAKIFGPTLVLEDRYRNLGFWASNSDRAVWDLEVPKGGQYNVRIEYACDASTAGGRLLFSIGDQAISADVESTGTWDDYVWRSIGTIKIPEGRTTANLKSAGAISSYLMDYRTIVLEPR